MSTPDWPRGVPTSHDPETWFRDHFDQAAAEIVEFLAGDGIDLAGKRVADIGCGDGLIDAGVFVKGEPEMLIGYDVRPVDGNALSGTLTAHGIHGLPYGDRLSFATSEPAHVPAPPDTFDVVFSWSTFEHVSDPPAMFREVGRILKPDGCFFLQVWPLFHSFHGGHLWLSVPEPFAHLRHAPHELEARLDGRPATDPTRSAVDEFRSLNRVTLDDLHRGLLLAGLRPTKVKPIVETFHVPAEVAHLPLSLLSVSGVQLIAAPIV
jgi:SAM-dependent methyltransferase